MKVHHVKSARKPDPKYGIQVGDSYYWWKFRYRSIIKSKTYPKQSQLTQSPFLSQMYTIQEDMIETIEFSDTLESDVECIINELRMLQEECESSLENMPEQLQEGSYTGTMLIERIEALDEMINEFEGIECEPDYDDEPEAEDYEDEEMFNADHNEWEEDCRIKEQDLIEELQSITYDGP